MLQKLSNHIADCFARAADAERRAAEASNEALHVDNEKMAKSWRHLAASYQFVESLERFLLDAEKAKGARPLDPPSETEVAKFPPPGIVFDPAAIAMRPLDPPSESEVAKFPPPEMAFDPETIAIMTTAYNEAIEGQPTSVHVILANRIIDLAAWGERDPNKLRHGALAQAMPQSPA